MTPEQPKRVKYTATMKFMDKDDGNVDFSMKFTPDLDPKGLMTPALKLAFDLREHMEKSLKSIPRPGQKNPLIIPPTIEEIKDVVKPAE